MRKVFWLVSFIIISTCVACESTKGKTESSENSIQTDSTKASIANSGTTSVSDNNSIKASVKSYAEPLLLMTENIEHSFVCYPFDVVMQNTEITVKHDVDKDGKEEDFVIRLGQIGPEVLCIKDDSGIEEDGEDDQCIQLSFVDLDNDSKEEIIIMFGGYSDGLVMDIFASVYRVSNTNKAAFEKVGEFESMFQINLKDNVFNCPYGGQGLFDEYHYENGKVIAYDEEGKPCRTVSNTPSSSTDGGSNSHKSNNGYNGATTVFRTDTDVINYTSSHTKIVSETESQSIFKGCMLTVVS